MRVCLTFEATDDHRVRVVVAPLVRHPRATTVTRGVLGMTHVATIDAFTFPWGPEPGAAKARAAMLAIPGVGPLDVETIASHIDDGIAAGFRSARTVAGDRDDRPVRWSVLPDTGRDRRFIDDHATYIGGAA